MIRGVLVESSSTVPESLNKGESFTWSTDRSVTYSGWQLCFSNSSVTPLWSPITNPGPMTPPNQWTIDSRYSQWTIASPYSWTMAPIAAPTPSPTLPPTPFFPHSWTMPPTSATSPGLTSEFFTLIGECDIEGDCVSSNNYPNPHGNHEQCSITMTRDAYVSVNPTFRLERCCDHLMIRDVDVESSSTVPESLYKGESFTWSTDGSVTSLGWQLCFSNSSVTPLRSSITNPGTMTPPNQWTIASPSPTPAPTPFFPHLWTMPRRGSAMSTTGACG